MERRLPSSRILVHPVVTEEKISKRDRVKLGLVLSSSLALQCSPQGSDVAACVNTTQGDTLTEHTTTQHCPAQPRSDKVVPVSDDKTVVSQEEPPVPSDKVVPVSDDKTVKVNRLDSPTLDKVSVVGGLDVRRPLKRQIVELFHKAEHWTLLMDTEDELEFLLGEDGKRFQVTIINDDGYTCIMKKALLAEDDVSHGSVDTPLTRTWTNLGTGATYRRVEEQRSHVCDDGRVLKHRVEFVRGPQVEEETTLTLQELLDQLRNLLNPETSHRRDVGGSESSAPISFNPYVGIQSTVPAKSLNRRKVRITKSRKSGKSRTNRRPRRKGGRSRQSRDHK